MSTKVQLDKMTIKQLMDLQARIEVAINNRKAQEKDELRAKMKEMAANSGFDVHELFGDRKVNSRKGSSVPPKYRNPENHAETWSGRGRQPRWLAGQIAKGKKLESFLIK